MDESSLIFVNANGSDSIPDVKIRRSGLPCFIPSVSRHHDSTGRQPFDVYTEDGQLAKDLVIDEYDFVVGDEGDVKSSCLRNSFDVNSRYCEEILSDTATVAHLAASNTLSSVGKPSCCHSCTGNCPCIVVSSQCKATSGFCVNEKYRGSYCQHLPASDQQCVNNEQLHSFHSADVLSELCCRDKNPNSNLLLHAADTMIQLPLCDHCQTVNCTVPFSPSRKLEADSAANIPSINGLTPPLTDVSSDGGEELHSTNTQTHTHDFCHRTPHCNNVAEYTNKSTDLALTKPLNCCELDQQTIDCCIVGEEIELAADDESCDTFNRQPISDFCTSFPVGSSVELVSDKCEDDDYISDERSSLCCYDEQYVEIGDNADIELSDLLSVNRLDSVDCCCSSCAQCNCINQHPSTSHHEVTLSDFHTLNRQMCQLWQMKRQLQQQLSCIQSHSERYHSIDTTVGVSNAAAVSDTVPVGTVVSDTVPVGEDCVSLFGADDTQRLKLTQLKLLTHCKELEQRQSFMCEFEKELDARQQLTEHSESVLTQRELIVQHQLNSLLDNMDVESTIESGKQRHGKPRQFVSTSSGDELLSVRELMKKYSSHKSTVECERRAALKRNSVTQTQQTTNTRPVTAALKVRRTSPPVRVTSTSAGVKRPLTSPPPVLPTTAATARALTCSSMLPPFIQLTHSSIRHCGSLATATQTVRWIRRKTLAKSRSATKTNEKL